MIKKQKNNYVQNTTLNITENKMAARKQASRSRSGNEQNISNKVPLNNNSTKVYKMRSYIPFRFKLYIKLYYFFVLIELLDIRYFKIYLRAKTFFQSDAVLCPKAISTIDYGIKFCFAKCVYINNTKNKSPSHPVTFLYSSNSMDATKKLRELKIEKLGIKNCNCGSTPFFIQGFVYSRWRFQRRKCKYFPFT